MDTPEKDKKGSRSFPGTSKPKPKKRDKKSSSLSSIPENMPMKNNHLDNGLILAVRNRDLVQVNFFLNDTFFNPNKQGNQQNTALHHTALSGNSNFIKLFLKNPRVDFTIKNKFDLLASNYIETGIKNNETENQTTIDLGQKISRLRTKFFARYTLSNVVNEQAQKARTAYMTGHFDQKAMNGIIVLIKKFIADDKGNQAAILPSQALLPHYATDKFIEDMLRFQINSTTNN